MNKVVFVAAPICILAAAAGAVPWYLGVQHERTMRAEVSKLSSRAQFPLNLTVTHYDRGWLSSSAVVRFTVKAEPSLYLDVRQDIAQWPDPRVGWVRVRSVPQWTGPAKGVFDYYFGGQPALTIDTVVGFDGSGKTTLNSPAFSKPSQHDPAATVSWGGLQGTMSLGADRHWVASATMPHLRVEGGDTQGGIKALQFDASWDLHGTVADWQGETKLALAEFRFSGPREQVALRDLSGAAYQRNKGDNVLLGYALRVGAGSSAKAGQAEDSFSNAVLDLEFDQIDKKALTKCVDDLGNTEHPAAQDQQATQTMMDLAAQLLRGSPVMRLKKLGVETPSGTMSAQATVSFDGSNLADTRFSPELLSRLKAKANVEIAAGLLRSQLQRKARPQVEVVLQQRGAQSTEENIQTLSDKLTEVQLKNLTDNGILRSNGTSFTIEAELTGGQVTVNGQPADRLFGGIALPPLPLEQPTPSARPEFRAGIGPAGPLSLVQDGAPQATVSSAR
ncbi:MAG TPA: DUF945 family protein [Burkholderiales bacterium]|nr:DUF945 family protein [Burkholderiales bacterium]